MYSDELIFDIVISTEFLITYRWEFEYISTRSSGWLGKKKCSPIIEIYYYIIKIEILIIEELYLIWNALSIPVLIVWITVIEANEDNHDHAVDDQDMANSNKEDDEDVVMNGKETNGNL